MDFSKKMVVFIIILAILFTISVLYIVKTGVPEPSVLVASVFAFLTGELWQLARIKINKEKGDIYDSEIDQ